jgi:hypothetical protein
MLKHLKTGLFCLFFVQNAAAQALSGISTRWNDSFAAWEVFVRVPSGEAAELLPDSSSAEMAEEAPVFEEELYATLQLRWLDVREDWSEWDFELAGSRGTIRQRWKDDPSQWELRSYAGDVITMKTAWNNDFSEWRVTDNNLSLTLKSRWTNQFDEWLVQDPNRGSFYLYTLRRQDPRDWAIDDRLSEAVSEPMKLALIFLTVFHASPRL